jgi:pilus assembly protein CpaB
MNNQRMLLVGGAGVFALVVAMLMLRLLGGGTQTAKAALPPPKPATSQVLVASQNLQPGTALTPALVRWQEWPKSAVDSSFITADEASNLNHVIAGAVVRAPMVSGEPLTASKMVHADSAGFMAAMVGEGMRAVSIGISTESGAGGFILPNDRVDVLVTQQVSESPRRFGTQTLLHDVRVLAVDQTFREDKDQKVVLAKTATLELTPHQAEHVEQAQATGTISLSLRALGDNGNSKTPDVEASESGDAATMTIIGYGVPRPAGPQGE